MLKNGASPLGTAEQKQEPRATVECHAEIYERPEGGRRFLMLTGPLPSDVPTPG